MARRTVSLTVIVVLLSGAVVLAKGRVAGRVLSPAGRGISGVEVILDEAKAARITDREGAFVFERVPEGSYSIALGLGGESRSITDVEVKTGRTTTVETTVDWQASFTDEITVAASRRVERVSEAPAAVVSLSEQAIARESGVGEIPKLLESAAGVDVVSTTGVFSEVNARGFNGYSTRRVQVFLDGVDQSVPFAGFQEYFPRNLTDLASVELVKGPNSSLYGANAFNGVLNLVTKRPGQSQGGTVRVSMSDPTLLRADLRWAGAIGGHWFVKLTANYQEGKYFSRSRNESTEYPGLPLELLALPNDTVEAGTYSVRLDRQFDAGSLLTLESGFQELGGNPVALAFPGRFTLTDPIEQVWLRLGFTSPRLDVRAYYTDRQADGFIDLATGGPGFDDSQRRNLELLAREEFRGSRVVVGASYQEDDIGHSVIPTPLTADRKAIFGQVDFELGEDVRLVLAARWDEGTLYDGHVSRKAGLVWGVTPGSTLRLTYNEAFQAPTYGDFFLDLPFFLPTPLGPISAVDLSAVEASLCAPFQVSCGFEAPTGVRLVGNQDLKVEEITTIELGWSGILGDRTFFTVDYYRNELEGFLTQPLPNPFGTFNSRLSRYRPPLEHPAPEILLSSLQAALGPLFPFLLSDRDGSPLFVPLGFTNAGRVESQGADLALSYAIGTAWMLDFTYSWFDFEIKDAGVAGSLFPSTPEHKLAAGLTYLHPRFDASLRYRWVDDFLWGSGVFVGQVPSYGVVTVSGNYEINHRWSLGLNVINLLDDEHYEAFGADLLGRRTLLSATLSW